MRRIRLAITIATLLAMTLAPSAARAGTAVHDNRPCSTYSISVIRVLESCAWLESGQLTVTGTISSKLALNPTYEIAVASVHNGVASYPRVCQLAVRSPLFVCSFTRPVNPGTFQALVAYRPNAASAWSYPLASPLVFKLN